MKLGDITVKRVAKDFDPKASVSELEIFHVACSGGKIKIEPQMLLEHVIEGVWHAECLRCGARDTFYGEIIAKIFTVAVQGRKEKYGTAIVSYTISPE